MSAPVHPGERGHVLVEALVAVLVVAALAGVLFDTLGGRAAAARGLGQRRLALLVARSQLAAAMGDQGQAPDGEEAGLRWHVDVAPYDGEMRSDLALEAVSVSVSDPLRPAKPLVVLHSLRVAR